MVAVVVNTPVARRVAAAADTQSERPRQSPTGLLRFPIPLVLAVRLAVRQEMTAATVLSMAARLAVVKAVKPQVVVAGALRRDAIRIQAARLVRLGPEEIRAALAVRVAVRVEVREVRKRIVLAGQILVQRPGAAAQERQTVAGEVTQAPMGTF